MRFIKYIIVVLFVSIFLDLRAGVILHKKDATVWGRQQIIKGEVGSLMANQGILYLNGSPIPFQISAIENSFEVPIVICEGLNTIVVEVDSSGMTVTSDTLKLTLGYQLRPEIYAFATVYGNVVRLHSQVIENLDSAALSFSWEADPMNPSVALLETPFDSSTNVELAGEAPYGEYYFNLVVLASDGDTITARTFVILDSTGIRPFQIKTDHAAWIDRAVLYEITPCDFVNNGKFQDITDKIPELDDLGVTALWMQPTFGTPDIGGMGYGITDYFSVRNDLGTEADLHHLIETAHNYGLKVLLDIVPNHTYLEHPYAINTVDYGTDSHYYDFYQRDATKYPNIPYSQYYHLHPLGFVYYFWELLPNLNYNNPEVQRWMSEICKYWIEEFDIDGYRFDAVWGVTARNPEYTKQLRLALKRIKPEILMLAEDKASWHNVFDERFDVSFDWAASESWVSQWSWQEVYHDYWMDKSITIFNAPVSNRSQRLRDALTNDGNGYHPRAKILRYMENNDMQRFIRHHGMERAKMVAALIFSLHGMPLIYNGQEIGFDGLHPYYGMPIFKRGQSIQSLDNQGLFPYYQRLIKLRKTLPALHSDNYDELVISPTQNIFAFRRWQDDQNVFTVLNMGDQSETANLSLPIEILQLDSIKTYYLTELMTGEVISGKPQELHSVKLALNKYSTKMYILADTVTATGIEELAYINKPRTFELMQNYPNPFNPSTTIRFSIPKDGHMNLKVYNILGKWVVTLIDDHKKAGSYQVQFNGNNFASGVYLYRLETGGNSIVRKMLLVK